MIPLNTNNILDESKVDKLMAINKIGQIVDVASRQSKGFVRVASSGIDANSLVNLFSQMLSMLNLEAGKDININELIQKLANNKSEFIKIANKHAGEERSDEIKIVSKMQRDSHYHIDISKDIIKKNGATIFMVSCYAKDAYLGRYIIKRNFYFTHDREKFADESYDEILKKMKALKNRYYDEVIDVSAITTQMRTILDGVISEIKSEDKE
jgi:hypothetical protein